MFVLSRPSAYKEPRVRKIVNLHDVVKKTTPNGGKVN